MQGPQASASTPPPPEPLPEETPISHREAWRPPGPLALVTGVAKALWGFTRGRRAAAAPDSFAQQDQEVEAQAGPVDCSTLLSAQGKHRAGSLLLWDHCCCADVTSAACMRT